MEITNKNCNQYYREARIKAIVALLKLFNTNTGDNRLTIENLVDDLCIMAIAAVKIEENKDNG